MEWTSKNLMWKFNFGTWVPKLTFTYGTTTLLFFHSHWSIPSFIQSIKKNYISILTSRLYITPHSTFHIPHSTFHVVTGCAEHSGAQVCDYWYFLLSQQKGFIRVFSMGWIFFCTVIRRALDMVFFKMNGLCIHNFIKYILKQ
jgi:hypothetical protein